MSHSEETHDTSWSANLEGPDHAASRELVVEEAIRAVERVEVGLAEHREQLIEGAEDGEGGVRGDDGRSSHRRAEDGGDEAGGEGDAERRAGEQEAERGDELSERYRDRRPPIRIHVVGNGRHSEWWAATPLDATANVFGHRVEPGF